MDIYEADRFMEEHPEVAVKAIGVTGVAIWVAWDYITDGNNCNRALGGSRENALAIYRDKYHPVKPKSPHPDVVKRAAEAIALYESAKYRKILKALEHSIDFTDMASFVQEVTCIVGDDLESHCTKCGQELNKTPIHEVP